MFLCDTNIFLEILLDQEKSENCKKILSEKIGNIHISDFSLHSIGVILFRHNKENIFKNFIDDIMSKIEIISLSKDRYKELAHINEKYNLDFDDSYQYLIAKENNLTIITMDNDFNKISDNLDILFV